MKTKKIGETMLVDSLPQELDQAIANATFGPFVSRCRDHGIKRTTAYKLLDEGLLDTFVIGRRRYVFNDSLRDLPMKILAASSLKGPAV